MGKNPQKESFWINVWKSSAAINISSFCHLYFPIMKQEYYSSLVFTCLLLLHSRGSVQSNPIKFVPLSFWSLSKNVLYQSQHLCAINLWTSLCQSQTSNWILTTHPQPNTSLLLLILVLSQAFQAVSLKSNTGKSTQTVLRK